MKASAARLVGRLRDSLLSVQDQITIGFPWAVVRGLTPLTVELPLSDGVAAVTSTVVPVGRLQVGDRVLCTWVGRSLILLAAPAAFNRTVPWSIQGRRVTVGPVGDEEPAYALQRNRPNYNGEVYLYMSASPNSSEFSVAVKDGGTTQATLRFDRDGVRHQTPSGGTRHVAFRDEVTVVGNRVTQLEKAAYGMVNIAVSAATGATAAVSFPAGRFSSSDNLCVQVTKASGALAKYVPYVQSVTATGMTVGIYSGDGTSGTGSVNIFWSATAY